MSICVSRRTVVAGTLALAAASRAPAAGARSQPNIVFIMADDLGYADLSCYGRRDFKTPNVDRLASQGVLFAQAYANSAVCSATRTALITGRYQDRLAAGLEEPIVSRDVGIPQSHPTLPSLLRDAGYETALVGKWHLGKLPKYGPLQSGYQHFWGYRGGAIDYFTHTFAGHADLWDNDSPIEQSGYITDLLGDRAIQVLGEFKRLGRPFLLSLHFSAPHWPWEGPADAAESKRLSGARTGEQMHDFDGGSQRTYAEMVLRLDAQVGRVLAELDRLRIADNTIVVFTSDNGGERFADTWPFTGRKTELLEGGIRIPAIVRWPGVARPASTSQAQIMSMDWMPTFLAAAGTRPWPSYPLDGINLAPALSGGTLPLRTLFWRYKEHEQRACRRGPWKYLKIDQNMFLFNVDEDPMERANLKVRQSQIFTELQRAWANWNATMLPIDPKSDSAGFDASELADHFGVSQDE